MGEPRLCGVPETDFQRLLFEKGFTSWYLFPAESFPNYSGFYPAFAYTLVLHTSPTYTAYKKLTKDGAWKAVMDPLADAEAKLRTSGSSAEEYWFGLAQVCMEQCATVFTKNLKTDMAKVVSDYRVQETSNAAFYNTIARHFKAFLCIHQLIDGQPFSKKFHSENKGDFAVFVNIAFEANSVLALIHKDFSYAEVPSPVFPNYTTLQCPGVDPILLQDAELIPAPSENAQDALIQSLLRTISLLSSGLARPEGVLPRGFADAQSELRTLRNVISRLIVGKGLPYEFNDPLFIKILEMEVEAADVARAPHTVMNCHEYPETEQLFDLHGELFHQTCLSDYLTVFSSNFTELILCPRCGREFPDSVLDLNPSVKRAYNLWKDKTIKQLPYKDFISLQVEKCSICFRSDNTALFQCKCRLCHDCASTSWEPKTCRGCNRPMTDHDTTAVSLLFQQFPLRE